MSKQLACRTFSTSKSWPHRQLILETVRAAHPRASCGRQAESAATFRVALRNRREHRRINPAEFQRFDPLGRCHELGKPESERASHVIVLTTRRSDALRAASKSPQLELL